MHAIVKFGSKVRGNSDEYSDEDLLIVCPDERRGEYVNIYLNSGFNLSFFSLNQLIWMRTKGSLFLQHIKRDGVIVYDSQNKFFNFINSCDFLFPSENELRRCESTISFLSELPDYDGLHSWKADFLYSVSRDYLIKMLASKGQLAFGIDEICDLSIKLLGVSKIDIENFKKLREIKSNYRNSKLNVPCFYEQAVLVESWLSTMMDNFNIKLMPKQITVRHALNLREFESTYEALRCLEALFILVELRGVNHLNHRKIAKYIREPNLYRILQLSKMKTIKKYINEMNSILENITE
ncbi:hypothetical protein PUG46_18365 [Erwiniaceae bacterium L1_55_4]|nr:hypothetical protein [Erwiniaceae bacterium L1_55_4]